MDDFENVETRKQPYLNLTVGEKLKLYRVGKKYTLEDLTKNTGISKPTLHSIENNLSSPKMSTLQKLSEFYGFNCVEEFVLYLNNMCRVPNNY